MNLYRYKETGKLYTLEHLISDIRHLNRNEFAGIYAYPYKSKGEHIFYQCQNHSECYKFVEEKFEIVLSNL